MRSALQHFVGRTGIILSFCGLAASLTGCCPSRFDRPDGPTPEAAELLTRMEGRVKKVRSFEYLTRMSYYGDAGARKGRVELLGEAPARLRMEALTPSDDTVAILISDSQRFISHERGQPVCYTGQACARNVSRLLPVSLEGPALYAVLVGGAPIMAHEGAQVEWDDCEGLWKVTLSSGTQVEEVWVRPNDYGAVKVRLVDGGTERFVISFDDFEAADGGIMMPRTLRFESPIGDTDLEVEVRELYLNQVKSEGSNLFDPQCPAGTRSQELMCH